MHIESVHLDIKYRCDTCEYKATQKGHLKTHMESVHSGIQYQCDKCEFKTKQRGNLKRHMNSAHLHIQIQNKEVQDLPSLELNIHKLVIPTRFMKLTALQDLAHSRKWGNRIRIHWKNMMLAGMIERKYYWYSEPRQCKKKHVRKCL